MTEAVHTIEAAIADLEAGRMIVLVDDADRENEGDLVVAAEKVTPEHINFMCKHARGLICLPMAEAMVDRLGLTMMVPQNRSPYQTAFTVSIEAKHGVSTGISAHDRAHTIRTAIADTASPSDIISPGHVFPLKAHECGVLARPGHTEGSVDLMRLAGLKPASVICEIIDEDGRLARGERLKAFAERHRIRIVTIEALIRYRWLHESLVSCESQASLPLKGYGNFTMKVFHGPVDNTPHVCLLKQPMTEFPQLRIHSECLTGDVFASLKCDCRDQLHAALAQIGTHGGMLIYLKQEGRGIGIANKLKAYALQQQGMDTVEANQHLGLPVDQRDYWIAGQIVKHHGIQKVKLMTNNPQKVESLQQMGITVQRMPLIAEKNEYNASYLAAKHAKLGHLLD